MLKARPREEGVVRESAQERKGRARPITFASAVWLLCLLPGGLTVAFSFSSGGFSPAPVALAAAGLAVLLALRVALTEQHPSPRLRVGYVAGAGALGLLAAWTLLSATWSGAPARAVIEYDRVLLYLLGFVVLGSLGHTAVRLRWVVRGMALAAFVVCLRALSIRLAPDVWTVESASDAFDRLTYPVGYYNALGLLAAIGIILCLALTSDEREPPLGRVLAAAALPVLAPTLLLTFSRGAIAAGVLGLLALLLAGRPRALLSGLVVAVPAITVSVMAAYDATLLAGDDPTSAAAAAEGHGVALVVGVCVVLAIAGRALLLLLDRRMARWRLPPPLRRPAVAWGTVAIGTTVILAMALSLGAPDVVERQYERFVSGAETTTDPRVRGRLTNVDNNGRLELWRVSLDAFDREPVHGEGAGGYALAWDRHRPEARQVEDGHSLYGEVLGELGMVGLLLVVAAVLLVLGGFLARARGEERVIGGALFGAGLAWALHAGIDWDWEMPAVTFWVFAAGGLALAAPAAERTLAGKENARAQGRSLPPLGRVLLTLGCLLLALLPAQIYLSERALRDGALAFAAGDCATAVDRALDSTAALKVRPEPLILLGYCDVRLGRPDLAVRAMREAVRLDPGNWEGHYGLALARGAAGLDPHPSLRRARRLNPREPLVAHASRLLDTRDPRAWKRLALRARLPVD